MTTILLSCGISDGPSLLRSTDGSPSDSYLSGLIPSTGSFSPTFTSTTLTYTESVANAVTSISFSLTANVSGPTITLNGIALVSGATSVPLSLTVGSNTVTIVVTSKDGTSTTTYLVTVYRNLAAGMTTLSSLSAGLGDYPYNGHLALSPNGHTLYGMVDSDGPNGKGTLLKIEADGTGAAVVYSFTGGSDGSFPMGGITVSLDGSTLYGMTASDGAHNKGTIFKVGSDGTGFTVLHAFAGGVSGGDDIQYCTLLLSGNTLYGMTHHGGTTDTGIIFSLPADGSSNVLTVLRDLSTVTDGTLPLGSLTLSGNTLYGMTGQGGDNTKCLGAGCGTIFSILSSNSKCNTTGPAGLRCCHAHKIL